MSLADIEVPAESLYSENRKLLDPVTPRRAFVSDPELVEIRQFPSDLTQIFLPNHPNIPEMGNRKLKVSGGRFYLPGKDVRANMGREIRLKDFLNLRLLAKASDGIVEAIFTSVPNKPVPRIQWVPQEGAKAVSVLMPDGSRVMGYGEESVSGARVGSIFQFERFGFVRLEGNDERDLLQAVFSHP
jgi:glutamyl-tRNA synthetase